MCDHEYMVTAWNVGKTTERAQELTCKKCLHTIDLNEEKVIEQIVKAREDAKL